ncbi:TIGR04141 family sporadically distributed protein [Pseudomonas sp. LS44]|uniref:DUF6119 family protein n=1 Tax=Pseudomonas sp. LS44 TaxID=1357074 RepID=UPI00215A1393|nr:TIGR04141 family sporadically distributed protein [Pseudomonas sp. LS44]UVE19407.1 TIGR04141 family sporadically distributed protein [Pseudomonas sp. LS44]
MKSRPFTIFLLKQGFDANNSLKNEHELDQAIASDRLPENSSVYILDSQPRAPWWREYFNIANPLQQANKGALVFIPVADRHFALSFGHVFHKLRDNCYEYDFGLLVTLNSLDPKKLKSADIMDPGASRRKRTQIPAAADITFLDFDSNTEIVRSLTGAVKEEFIGLFKSATGSASLKISLKLLPEELHGLCNTLLDLYRCEDYLETFPSVGKISPENDPDIIQVLDEQLLECFISQDPSLSLCIPDIVDYRDNTSCRFQGRGGLAEIYTDISLDAFYDYLGEDTDLNVLTIEKLKSFSLALCDAEGNISRAYNIYNCLLLDIVEGHKFYHLCEGGWYRVEREYIEHLKQYLDAKCEPNDLFDYNHDLIKDGLSHYSEETYNEAVANAHPAFICLDQQNMSIDGQTAIEPCDLYMVIPPVNGTQELGKLYHLKISTRSSQLSHLFNQGTNSAELIILEPRCRDALKQLITDRIGQNDLQLYHAAIDNINIKIVYGIITTKSPADLSDNLPLFSRISLMRCFKSLDLMQISSALIYIPDASPPKNKSCALPAAIVEVVELKKGKKEIRVIAGQTLQEGLKVSRCSAAIAESAAGSQFKILYKINKEGAPYSSHRWPHEAVN